MSKKDFGTQTFTVMNRLISTVDFLKKTVDDWLGSHSSQLFITNIDNKKLKENTFYCVVLDKNEIQFSEKDKHNRLTYTFNLKNTTLKKNDREVHLDELDDFIKKLQSVMDDVKRHKARAYEKA